MTKEEYGKKVTQLKPYLMFIAMKYTLNHPDADDLYQETVLRGLKYLNHFTYGEAEGFKKWINSIMKSVFVNAYRLKKKAELVSYEDFLDREADEEFTAHEYSDLNSATNNFSLPVVSETIIKALEKVSVEKKTCFLLASDGWTYKEIQDFVGCKMGTVRSRIHRAMCDLQLLLKNYVKDIPGYQSVDSDPIERLRDIRKYLKIPQCEMARRLGLSHSRYCMIENYKIKKLPDEIVSLLNDFKDLNLHQS